MLRSSQEIQIARVVLVKGGGTTRRSVCRVARKTLRIGLAGALNGVRIRDWYADHTAPDLIDVARDMQVPMEVTQKLNSRETRRVFRQADADLGLSLGNGFIGPRIFAIPRFGMVNIHSEVLPDFRGAQSVIWPIYEGVRQTGFTIHQIDEGIDTGAILFREARRMSFGGSLRETVELNLAETRRRIPPALCHVCENYKALKANSTAQPKSGHVNYTTPTGLQFLRMLRNHRRLAAEQDDSRG